MNNLLLGVGRWLVPIPPLIWKREIANNARASEASLGFMSADHHTIRNFVVREMPRIGVPLSPERIAQGVELPVDRVIPILDELEKNLTFLFRNEQGAVTWAYPVTVDKTPHRLKLNTGEVLNAA